MNVIANAVGALVLGAIGWLALEFVGRPVRNFFDLRGRIKAQMLQCIDAPDFISFDLASSSVRKDKAALAKLANELIAFGQSEWLAARFVKCLGFDSVTAGTRLATLVAELGTPQEDRNANYEAADSALKF
jgi:hypothetical protein